MLHIPPSHTYLISSSYSRTIIRLFHRSAKQYAQSLVETSPFEELGINEFVAQGLKRGFPHIIKPTSMQREFIPAIMSGKDVLLQDKTGTGKSLGILLALLSKPRAVRREAPRYWKDRAAKPLERKPAITSILVVPHNDLALQYAQWIKDMRLSRDTDEVVQTLLKDPGGTWSDQLARIGRTPPHILITTPKGLDSCWGIGRQQLTVEALSTVVLEEADLLLKIPSNNTPVHIRKRWKQHPPVIRDVLVDIFKLRPKNESTKKGSKYLTTQDAQAPLQLVFASATLRPAVRQYLFLETKWLSQEKGGTVTIESTGAMDERRDPVEHYGLFVDISGRVRNIVDTEAEFEEEPLQRQVDLEGKFAEVEELEESPSMDDAPSTNLTNPATPDLKFLGDSKQLETPVLDAVVSFFVLDVPRCALLIIPSDKSASRTVESLKDLGVKAINLDDYVGRPREVLHRLRIPHTRRQMEDGQSVAANEPESSESSEPFEDEPLLLVAIQSAVRGIDLPSISHVFIAGAPESDVEYLHLAGRVGRMGGHSVPKGKGNVKKVVTFLPERSLARGGGTQSRDAAKESKKQLERIWNMVRVKPTWFNTRQRE